MIFPFQNKIWFYPVPVNFNKQIDGLSLLIADHLQENPTSGQLFLFRNKQADKLRLLYWEGDGYCLFYKRLSRGRFKFPSSCEQKFELNYDQLSWLLSGLNLSDFPVKKQTQYSCFC
jgi:transposase